MLIDGQPSQSLPATDRGLQYGDGLFETLSVIDGEPALWEAHMARLTRGCRQLGMPAPPVESLLADARQLAGGYSHAVLKIVVTRGSGGRGYRAPAEAMPRRIVSIHPFPDYPHTWWQDGVDVRLCDTRLGDQPLLAGLKHLNRLEQVLARSEWADAHIAEGLMFSQNGNVVEGTVTNVFAVIEDELATPSLERAGVAGVMRDRVMGMARAAGFTVKVTEMGLESLYAASEVFLTNSLIGIWPVRSVDGKLLSTGRLASTLLRNLTEENAVAMPGR